MKKKMHLLWTFFLFGLVIVSHCMCPAENPDKDLEGLSDGDGDMNWDEMEDQTGIADEYDDAESFEKDEELSNKPTMKEILIATSGKRFDSIFGGQKRISAQTLLDYLISSTNVDPQYLKSLFQRALKIKSGEEGFKNKMYTMDESGDFLGKIVGYVQDDPDDVGRRILKESNEEKKIKENQQKGGEGKNKQTSHNDNIKNNMKEEL